MDGAVVRMSGGRSSVKAVICFPACDWPVSVCGSQRFISLLRWCFSQQITGKVEMGLSVQPQL